MIWIYAIISGILGRMGGSDKYDTKFRDIGVSLLTSLILGFAFGWTWWLLWSWILLFVSLTTYWDKLWGYDNLWFSGVCVSLSTIPLIFDRVGWQPVLIRTVLLGIIWECLNRFMPKKLLFWRGDVANEFLRYASVVATLPIIGV